MRLRHALAAEIRAAAMRTATQALKRPFRFVLVGLACAVLHNVIMIGLDRWNVHYALSSMVSFVVVVLFGYALHVRFTYGVAPGLASFWRYGVSMAANYPMTLALLFVMCDLAGWPVAIAAPVATVAMFAWNYVASRWAIVRNPSSAPGL